MRVRNLAARRRSRNCGRDVERADNVAINVGGPLEGIITISAAHVPSVVVEATWRSGQRRGRISVTRFGEREALIVADSWANQLIDGHAPTRDVRRRYRWG